ncbi:F-box/kelch-repeat protein [Trifolium repens]|nr:F-box/kelch-repeat protein [Trifolium repens]
MDETTAVKRLGGGNSLHSSPPSTYIPLDIIQETILCRLPVKSLQRFRWVCNSWDSLVSKDLKFAKRHLHVSPKRQHLVTTTWRKAEELTVMSCPFDSLNLHSNFDSKSTQLDYSPIISTYHDGPVACCDGILCFAIDERLAVLYNPCIRKLHKLPCIDLPQVEDSTTHYAFGYDPFIDNYKVVAVFNSYETQVEVHSYNLCTDSWKRIKDFPSGFYLNSDGTKHGTFMRDTVNWLTHSESTNSDAIVSLHLGKETYQEISLPDLRVPSFNMLSLYVMRDCLCLFNITKERRSDSFTDVWLMKEYGNKESWIKLFCIPSFGEHTFNTDIVYISEDDNHVLLVFRDNRKSKWVVYDFINDTITIKNSKSQDNLGKVKSKIYVESLITP